MAPGAENINGNLKWEPNEWRNSTKAYSFTGEIWSESNERKTRYNSVIGKERELPKTKWRLLQMNIRKNEAKCLWQQILHKRVADNSRAKQLHDLIFLNFYWPLLCCFEFLMGFTWFYRVPQGFMRFYWVLLGFVLSFTRFNLVWSSFTGSYGA